MEEQNKSVNLLYIFLLPTLLQLLCFITKTQAITNQNISSNSLDQHRKASAIFVFGDSTVDPGNNNFIPTIFRGNFMPYGRDFSGRKSTGRFSNGRLATDFIASYVGVKDYVPPYLDPDLTTKELMSGVSFASGGTGYDPMTAQIGNVLTMPKQLEYFKEYKKRIEAKIGRQQTEEHIKKGIFVISAGTNDFVVNYFMLPLRRKVYNVPSYERFVIQHAKQFLQSLWAEGARRMLVVGLPPMGCLPMVITLKSAKGEAINHRSCLDNYSSVGREYNIILQKELNNLQNGFASSGTRISYFDIYNPAMDLIHGYKKFGFEDVLSGCCGTGYLEASFLCNPLSYVCPDASKYLFFDSIHPTETTYYYVFKNVCPVIDRLLQGI